jgi:uncharacterized protein with von Willebrand factor type A (vWA) domain
MKSVAAYHTESHRSLSYGVSRWERLLFDARVENPNVLTAAIETFGGAIRPRAIGDGGADFDRFASLATDFASEVFARLYGEPARLDETAPEAPWAPKAHEVLDGIEEFSTLAAEVAGDPDFSAIASSSLLRAIADRLPEILREVEREEDEEAPPVPGAGEGLPSDEDRIRAALRSACAKASGEVAEGRAALSGLAPGLGSVPRGTEQVDPRRLALVEALRSDERLRRIIRLAGRMARTAARKNPTRSETAREQVVDVERGRDLARLVPTELSRLRHPRLRKLALYEIASGRALQYKLEGTEPLSRGGIVLCVDESGSMDGRNHDTARALVVATIGQAIRERRACTVVGFDHGIRSIARVEADGRTATLRSGTGAPVRRTVADLLFELLSTDTGGGTDFDVPLLAASDVWDADRADLLFVTDGLASVSTGILDRLVAAKRKGLRVFGLLVGPGSVSPAVAAIADEVTRLDETSAAKALGKALR